MGLTRYPSLASNLQILLPQPPRSVITGVYHHASSLLNSFIGWQALMESILTINLYEAKDDPEFMILLPLPHQVLGWQDCITTTSFCISGDGTQDFMHTTNWATPPSPHIWDQYIVLVSLKLELQACAVTPSHVDLLRHCPTEEPPFITIAVYLEFCEACTS